MLGEESRGEGEGLGTADSLYFTWCSGGQRGELPAAVAAVVAAAEVTKARAAAAAAAAVTVAVAAAEAVAAAAVTSVETGAAPGQAVVEGVAEVIIKAAVEGAAAAITAGLLAAGCWLDRHRRLSLVVILPFLDQGGGGMQRIRTIGVRNKISIPFLLLCRHYTADMASLARTPPGTAIPHYREMMESNESCCDVNN